jgi:hypothetical protein
MLRRPNLFKYLPIRLRIFNCWVAFLQISDICLSKFRWESTVMSSSIKVFINDIFYFVQESTINNYADDNALSYSDTDINKVVKTLENDYLIVGLLSYKFLIYVYQNLDGNQRLCLKV